MPEPDTSCVVINGKNGYTRSNTSWVIGRLVRDYESWMDPKIEAKVKEMISNKWTFDKNKQQERHEKAVEAGQESILKTIDEPKAASLCVSIYKATGAAGKPKNDLIYWAGVGIALLQLGIASIPCGLYGDWGILMVTAAGIVLAFLTGSLPQWSAEKWAGRKASNKKIILTRGNGSQHAIVVLGNDVGLDLEDLAAVGNNTDNSASRLTRSITIVLAGFWILLLITAAGLDQNNWFLLLVGAVGILQNILAAGSPRSPSAMGILLQYDTVVGEAKVMETLYEVEKKHRGVGYSMLDTFFPGGNIFPKEKVEWNKLNRKYFPELTKPEVAATPEAVSSPKGVPVLKVDPTPENVAEPDAHIAMAEKRFATFGKVG